MKRIGNLVLLLAAGLGGCLEREMHITSEPEGALVIVSDVEKGRTPLTLPFTWYGDYDIMLRRDGYETLIAHAKLTPPAREVVPLDLFAEIVPWTYRDRRYLHFKMEKLTPISDAALLEKADKLRGRTIQPIEK